MRPKAPTCRLGRSERLPSPGLMKITFGTRPPMSRTTSAGNKAGSTVHGKAGYGSLTTESMKCGDTVRASWLAIASVCLVLVGFLAGSALTYALVRPAPGIDLRGYHGIVPGMT